MNEKQKETNNEKELKTPIAFTDLEPKDIIKNAKEKNIKNKKVNHIERKIKRGIPIIDKFNPEIHRYRSIAEAARILGYDYDYIYNIVRYNTESGEKLIAINGQYLVDAFEATFNFLTTPIPEPYKSRKYSQTV